MVEKLLATRVMKGIAWLLICALIQFCTVPSVSAFSIGDEREVGEKLLYSVRSTFNLVDDPDVTQYINRLGKSVLEVAGFQYFDYRFFVIDNNEFNAFAAPSGLIFFHSGLISTMENEDELVSVLAHEVGHIAKRHLASRVEKGKYTTIGSLGLALAALAFGGAATPVLLSSALATGQSINLHFSRQDEEEADLLAYGWMKKLHRNPEAQANMLESMRRIARYRSEKPPQYLLTHPNPEERLNYIESLIDIDKGNLEKTTEKFDNFEFMRFKYRILAKAQKHQDLKSSLATLLADNRTSEFTRVMGEYGLSQVAINENDSDRSLALLENVINYFPNKNILKVDKGIILLASGQIEKAETILRGALDADSSDMYATFTLAKLLYRTGRISEAEQYFKTVSYELPEYPDVYFELGQIASDQKQAGRSNFFLGKYYLYEGQLEQAEQNLKLALKRETLSGELQEESKGLLKKIEQLRK